MLFYWILFILMFLFVFFNSTNKDKTLSIYHWCFAIMLFLGATRAETVGTDLHGGYSYEFKAIHMDPSTWGQYMYQFEVGFAWIMAAFKTYISDVGIYFFHIIFAITFILCSLIIKRYSVNPAMTLFFLVGMAYYFSFFNTMRQHLCFSLICMFLPWVLEKNKFIKFAIATIIISYLFHKSQIVLCAIIPIAIFYKKNIFSTKNLIIISAITSAIGILFTNTISSQLANFAFIYEGDNSNYAGYLSYDENIGEYSNISNIFNTLFAIYIVYTHRFKKDVFLVLYVLGIIILNLLTPVSWIYMRIAFTFMYFRIFTYTTLWYEIPNKKEKLIYRFIILLYTFIMFNNRLINDNYSDVVPYSNYYFNTL